MRRLEGLRGKMSHEVTALNYDKIDTKSDFTCLLRRHHIPLARESKL